MRAEQITFNHSSDIDFKDFMNLYKKWASKPCSFLVIDTALETDNPLGFRKNLLERIYKPITTIHDKIRNVKLQHNSKRETT